ncbi:MAG: GntR family transcriptional regulator [Anaerolineales bacterium]|nr:GntR family transcriptional regulator [Anaerolineales bacterium]
MMMRIDIDLTDHVPIYIQLMNQIKHMIATGELKPGDQLPTVRQLAADLRINFNTVARAYRLLDEEQIISTQHGRGTFILKPTSEEDSRRLRRRDMVRLMNHFLNDAVSLGFEPADVRAVFEKSIGIWEETGAPPSPDDL